jgi:hypothetical protein
MLAKDFPEKLPLFTIFLLILIISANSLLCLFPCRFQKLLLDNIVVKHVFAFFIMSFSIILLSPVEHDRSVIHIFSKTIFLYIIFVLITKCNEYFFFLIIGLLGISYLVVIEKMNQKEVYMKNSKLNNEDEDRIIFHKIEKKLEIYNEIITVIYVCIILFTICGLLIYMGKKKYKHGNKFNYFSFFFGKCVFPENPKSLDNISMLKSLEYSFV